MPHPSNRELADARISPHTSPVFMRMMRMFGLVDHPASEDDDTRDESQVGFAQWWQNQFEMGGDRKERYRIFAEMNQHPLIAGILDTYAEEATQVDHDRGRAVWVESRNAQMTECGDDCLRNTAVEDKISVLTRHFCMKGDDFRRLVYRTGAGVLAWRHTDTAKVQRREDKLDRLAGFSEDGINTYTNRGVDGPDKKARAISFPWDYIHFRLLGANEQSGYGTSVLEPMFRPWRQLCVAAGAKLWTTGGPVAIEDVEPGMEVYCHDPDAKETRETEVVAAMRMGRQRVVRLRTAHRQIFVTANHGMLVRDKNGNFLYKAAGDLIANGGVGRQNWRGYNDADSLVLPQVGWGETAHTIRVPPEGYTVWLANPVATGEGVMSRIRGLGLATSDKNAHAFLCGLRGICYEDYVKLQREWSEMQAGVVRCRGGRVAAPFGSDFAFVAREGFARLLGFMLGDGWVRKNGVSFALGEDEAQNARYEDLFEEVFGALSATRTAPVAGARGGCVDYHSRPLADLWRSAGFVTGFADKVVPPWVYGMSLAFRRAVVAGMLDADGGKQGNGYRLMLANRPLLDGIVTLCQMSGFRVSREVETVRRDGREDAYRIYVSGPHDDAVVYEAVTHVDDAGEVETYDITVADDVHNFVADGVVSHNTLAEDATLLYRIRRAPDRNMVLVDVGDMDPVEARKWVETWRKKYRKNEFVDPANADYRKQYNPFTSWEDVWMAVRQGRDTRVETLSGAGEVGSLGDLNDFRRTLFGAARVPPAYMGFEGEINAKATLMQQDIRFARTIKRVRRAQIYGLRQLLDIHYALQATTAGDLTYDPTHKDNAYAVCMAPISYLDEYERLELSRLRWEIVDAMNRAGTEMKLDPRVWTVYILTNIARLPEEIVMKLVTKVPDDPATATGGFGGGFEDLDPATRRTIVEEIKLASSGQPEGYYQLSEKEKKMIGQIITDNTKLQHTIAELAAYAADDLGAESTLEERAAMQVDPSLILPMYRDKEVADCVQEDPLVTAVREDLVDYDAFDPKTGKYTDGTTNEVIKRADAVRRRRQKAVAARVDAASKAGVTEDGQAA